MRFTYLDEGDIKIICLEGRMDLANAMKAESRLSEMLGEGAVKVIIDLEKLDYLSSSGLRLFISVEKKLRERNGRLVLSALSSPVENLLNITQLQDLFIIRKTLPEALEAFN